MPSMAALSHVTNVNPTFFNLLTPKRLFLSPKPMVVSMSTRFNNNSYWASVNDEIDAHLKQSIPLRPPLSVFEPMHHFIFAAPRTAASTLCIATCELVGGSRDQAMAAASAFRVMHAAAFTHDQLLNRSKPNDSQVFGPNIELLTGDGLMLFGLELLASLDNPAQNNSDRVLRVIREVTRAIGLQGIVYGQFNELRYRQSNGHDEAIGKKEWIDHVCNRKEGELHACAGACGAILGGGSEEEVEKLRRYGFYVGVLRGLLNWNERQGAGAGALLVEEVNDLRKLAIKELDGFNQEKIEEILTFN